MLNVTTAFNEAFKSDLREVKMRIKINDVTYTDEDIVSFNYNSGSIVGESFAIGSTFANTIKLTLCKIIEELKQLDEVIPEMGIVLPDKSTEWVKLGTFIISEEVNPDRNENRTSLECTDKMIMLDDIYKSKLKYPAKIRDVALEIANLSGVQIDQVSFGRLMQNTIREPKDYTYRQALGLIAQFEAGYVCFDRNGLLAIKQLEDKNYQITPNEYFLKGLTKNEIKFRPAGIQVKVNSDTEEDKVLKIGNEKGSVIHLENKVMTDGLLKLVYDKVKDINYYPYTLKWRGNPAIEVGDWLQVTDTKGNLFKVPNLSYSFEYKGGMTATSTVETVASNEVRFGYKGILDQTVEYVENALKDVGGNLIYYGVEAPPNPKEGDTWFKYVDSDTEIWVYEKVEEPDVFDWVFKITSAEDETIKEKIKELEDSSKQQQLDIDKSLSNAEKAREEAEQARKDAFDSSTIAKQAEKDALTALLKGDQNSSQITVLEGGMQLTNTKVDGNTAQISTLKSDSERLSSTIGKVEADLENMEIGATNYLPLSSGMDEVSYKSFGYGGFQSELLPEGNGIWIKKNFVTGGTRSFFTKYIKAEEKDLPANTEITLSMEISNELPIGSNSHYFIRWFIKDGTFRDVPIIDLSTIGVSKAHRKIYATGKVPYGVDYSKNLQFTVALSRVDDEVIIRKFQMEKGNKVSDWKPSFSDLTTKNEFSTFEQTVNGFQANVNSSISGLQSQQTQMAGQITQTVETVNNIEIGGTNIIPLSDLNSLESTGSFTPGGLITINFGGGYTKIRKETLPNSRSFLSKMIDIKPLKNSNYVSMSIKMDIVRISNQSSTMFLRVYNKGTKGPTFKDLCENSLNTLTTSWGTLEANSPLKFSDGFEIDFDRLAQMSIALGSVDDEVNLKEWKLERGNKVTDWQPAPEDNASKSEVIQLSDQITQTVNKVETVDGKVTSQQSQITQLSNNINLKVDKDNVIAQINLSHEQVLIQAKRIHLSGESLIDDAIITNAMIKNVSADKMTVGTLNGDNVNIINLNASNIVSGTINAIDIKGSTITGSIFESLGNKVNMKLYNGALHFWDIRAAAPKIIAGFAALYKPDGSIHGASLAQESGYELSLGTSAGDSSGVTGIVIIPKESTPSKPLLQINGEATFNRNSIFNYRAHLKGGISIGTNTSKHNIHEIENRLRLDNEYGMDFCYNHSGELKYVARFMGGSEIKFMTPQVSGGAIDIGSYGTKVWGNFNVYSGSKNAVHVTRDGMRATPAYETAESYLGDIGSSETSDNKSIVIGIERLFSDTVNTIEYEYQVFLQSYGDGLIWVSKRDNKSFTVRSSKSNVKFGWEIKARRRGYENERLVLQDDDLIKIDEIYGGINIGKQGNANY